MNRRSFFRGAVALPALLAGALTALAADDRITRVSSVKSDPGYRAWCMLMGDRKNAKVFLDGVEQKWAKTADSAEGWVLRIPETPNGNMAHGVDELFEEVVYGRVEIRIVDSQKKYQILPEGAFKKELPPEQWVFERQIGEDGQPNGRVWVAKSTSSGYLNFEKQKLYGDLDALERQWYDLFNFS